MKKQESPGFSRGEQVKTTEAPKIYGNERQQQAFDEAWENWHVTQKVTQGRWCLVNAEAETGSRYLVTAYRDDTGAALQQSGGAVIVSVLSPWRTAYPVNTATLHPSYVAEKFVPTGRVNAKDLAALTRTITRAIAAVTEGVKK